MNRTRSLLAQLPIGGQVNVLALDAGGRADAEAQATKIERFFMPESLGDAAPLCGDLRLPRRVRAKRIATRCTGVRVVGAALAGDDP